MADAASAPTVGQPTAAPLDPEVLAKIVSLRSHVRERFGKAVMAMIMLRRWRQQTLADLQHLVLEPLIRDRVGAAQRAGIVYPPARWNRPVQNRPRGHARV